VILKKVKVATIIPTLDTGGAEKLAIDLVSNVNTEKFEVILISLFPQKNSIYEVIASERGIRVIYLNKRPGLDLFTFFELWKTLQKFKPDVVHTHIYTSTYVWPWMMCHKKAKWVHTVHSVASKELYSFHKPIMTTVYKSYRNFAPVAISNYIKQSVLEEYQVPESRINLVYNGIDLKFFNPSETKKNKDSTDMEFICVARLNPVKNHKLLLNAFYELLKVFPQSRLTLVGEGELRPELEKIIIHLKIQDNVDIIGETNDVRYYLTKADIFILTSKYEGLPLSILESMAVGLPIIATEVGGIPDIVKNEINGVLVESEDVSSLSNAMIRIVKDFTFRKRVSLQNKMDAKKYDLSSVARKYEDIYLSNNDKY
jgi:glycosyltransferase involved in cell wall biosynthesis